MVDKVLLISHPNFYKKNLDHIIRILLDNDYPLKFIFDTIRLRIKILIKRNIGNHKNKKHSENVRDKITWFTIP